MWHLGGKVRVATKMVNRQCGANWSDDETWIIIRIHDEESFKTILWGTPVNEHVYEDIAKILSPFSYNPKEKENNLKLWKCHVLTTYTSIQFVNTAHSYDIYTITEIDIGPELSTAAADQIFLWICKQLQDQTDSVPFFRTKFIWSGPEFGLVRCGYLNGALITTCILHVFY